MKRICTLLTLICLLAMTLPVQSVLAAPIIGLFLDDQPLSTDVPPALIGGRTLVPLRVVSESLGAEVVWKSNREPIIIRKGTDEISLTIGVKTATRNGQSLTLDVPAQMLSGRTMVPLRFISESFGANVAWVSSPPSVRITSPNGELSQATVERKNGLPSALVFTSSKAMTMEQPMLSVDGREVTVKLRNITAQAETANDLGDKGLVGYAVLPGEGNTAAITVRLGEDAGYRSPRAELSADRKSLAISWPLTLKTIEFVKNGGVEHLSFGTSPAVQPELVATTMEVGEAGTLVGRANAEIGVNLRPGPSTALERIGLVKYNEIVTVVSETTGWYQVRLADGREGWMSDDYLAVETSIEESIGVNVRKSPSTQAERVALLQQGHKIIVLERTEGWCLVDYGAGKKGYIADWLVPISSRLTGSTTVQVLKLTFPGLQKDAILAGDIAQSGHIANLAWQEDSTGVTATIQLQHEVGHKLSQTEGGWRLTLGTWVTGLQLTQSSGGSKVRISLDGQSEPKVAYIAASQEVVITVANATLAPNVPASLAGDGVLVSAVKVEQVGNAVRMTASLLRKTAYHLGKVDDSTWEVGFSSPTLVGKNIALDPGHGATDPGAMGTKGMNEKDYTHDIVNRLRTLLQGAGANVIATREIQSPAIVHYQRAALINQSNAELFLSVHINSFTSRSVRGLETYYYPRNDNERFARLVQGELVSSLGWLDRGVKSNTAYILPRETLTTGALAEIGFISNPEDESLLYQANVRQQIAEALFRAIERYFAN